VAAITLKPKMNLVPATTTDTLLNVRLRIAMIKPRVSTGMAIPALLWPEFVVVKGCVFLKGVMRSSMGTRFSTRTEFDENPVHLLDYFTHGARMRR
jgi:hypothetical protein